MQDECQGQEAGSRERGSRKIKDRGQGIGVRKKETGNRK